MKLHDLKPGRRLAHGPDARRSRDRRRQGQDGRSRHQGPEGARRWLDPALVRGRPDPAPHADPEAARLQEPLQDRLRGRQRRRGSASWPSSARSRPASTPAAKAKAKPAPITVNQEILRAVGLVRTLDRPMKVLGRASVDVALFVVADAFSRSAVAKIEAAGGSVQVLEIPTRPLPALGLDADAAGPTEAPAEAAAVEADASEAPAPKAPGPARLHRPRPSPPRSRWRPGRRSSKPRPRQPSPSPPSPRPASPRPPTRLPSPRPSRSRPGQGAARRRRRRRARLTPGTSRPLRARTRPATTSGRRRRLTRDREPAQRLPGAGSSPAAAVRRRDPDRLPVPGRTCRCPGVDRGALATFFNSNSLLRAARPVLGRRAVAGSRSSALGREPVHQRLDHHAADDERRPAAPGAEPGGRVRAQQDQPVHPLPDRAAGPPPGRTASWPCSTTPAAS